MKAVMEEAIITQKRQADNGRWYLTVIEQGGNDEYSNEYRFSANDLDLSQLRIMRPYKLKLEIAGRVWSGRDQTLQLLDMEPTAINLSPPPGLTPPKN